ncbi:hypothetical protein B0J18DRAFT_425190 [Chaetomium sp. MPI-SDFR-AT-0129]|nr:hypothetical protein B0J18DRAFT_425190 [Chaetomium sp. MPI-SDFR-AT-0129]
MQLTTIFTLLAGTTATVSAVVLTPRATSRNFILRVQDDQPGLRGQVLSASKSRLWVSLPEDKQDAQCEKGPEAGWIKGAAALFLRDSELFLYGGGDHAVQKFGVDRQANDRDNLKYFDTTHDNPSDTVVTRGWYIDSGRNALAFSGALLLACPESGAYTVGVFQGKSTPEDRANCIPFHPEVVENDASVPCEYSEE